MTPDPGPAGPPLQDPSTLVRQALEAETQRELELVVQVWLAHGYSPLMSLDALLIIGRIDLAIPPYPTGRQPRTFAELVAAIRNDLRNKAKGPERHA